MKQLKVLPLDNDVLMKHYQKFPNSCVTMGIEFALKLMHMMPSDSFKLQETNGDYKKSGKDFNGKTIQGVKFKMEFNISRGHLFPLDKLFERIKFEIDNGRYVNCAWQPSKEEDFHAFVIYGYETDEFLAITKYYNDSQTYYVNDMKTRLKNIQGSDIITFTI